MYVSDAVGAPERAPLNPGAGDILVVQGIAADPVHSTAQSIIANASAHVRPGDVPAREVAHPQSYALLGAGFEQATIRFRVGPLAPQVSTVTGIPAHELLLETQRQPLFEHVCIQGVAVHRCMSYRSDRYFRRGVGYMLFFDARALGVPICSRNVPQIPWSPDELAGLLDVELPAGSSHKESAQLAMMFACKVAFGPRMVRIFLLPVIQLSCGRSSVDPFLGRVLLMEMKERMVTLSAVMLRICQGLDHLI